MLEELLSKVPQTEVFRLKRVVKNTFFGLHPMRDLCIIIARPPPRWAKWSRGVRTRGLRVGLVGGPRPLFFLGSNSGKLAQVVDFQAKWHNIPHG